MPRWILGLATVLSTVLFLGAGSSGRVAAPRPVAAAQAPQQAWDIALALALERRNGIFLDPLSCGDQTLNPQASACVIALSMPAEAALGIARFLVTVPGGERHVVADTLARDAQGVWHPWLGDISLDDDATVDRLRQLPGALVLCAGDGDPVEIYAAASEVAPTIATLKVGTRVQAEEFVLAWDPEREGPPHYRTGWYRLSVPVSGWVWAFQTTDARLPDCRLHDYHELGG